MGVAAAFPARSQRDRRSGGKRPAASTSRRTRLQPTPSEQPRRTRARRQLGDLGRRHDQASAGTTSYSSTKVPHSYVTCVRASCYANGSSRRRASRSGSWHEERARCPRAAGPARRWWPVSWRAKPRRSVVIDLAGMVEIHWRDLQELSTASPAADRGNSASSSTRRTPCSGSARGPSSDDRYAKSRSAHSAAAHGGVTMDSRSWRRTSCEPGRCLYPRLLRRSLPFPEHGSDVASGSARSPTSSRWTPTSIVMSCQRFPLSGNIRNAALTAAFLAAPECGAVRRDHVLAGIRADKFKLGGRDSGEKP